MHRTSYLQYRESAAERQAAHDAYFGQYVTDKVTELVLRHITLEALVASQDPHLNDILLERWDRMVPFLPYVVVRALSANGDFLSLGTGVCILKAAAKQIIKAHNSEVLQ